MPTAELPAVQMWFDERGNGEPSTFAPTRRAAPSVQRSSPLPLCSPSPCARPVPVDRLPMVRNAGKFGIVSRRRWGEAT